MVSIRDRESLAVTGYITQCGSICGTFENKVFYKTSLNSRSNSAGTYKVKLFKTYS